MRTSNPRWSVAALAVLLAVGYAPQAAAQWKWRDRSGQIQYSDRPPPLGTPEASVLQRPGAASRTPLPPVPAASASASSATLAAPPSPRASEPELETRRRKAEQDEALRKKIDDERQALLRAERCSRARGQLRALDEGMRIARVNENGEREILGDDARAVETQRMRSIIDADCR